MYQTNKEKDLVDIRRKTRVKKNHLEDKDTRLSSFVEFKNLISCQSPNPRMFDETKTR